MSDENGAEDSGTYENEAAEDDVHEKEIKGYQYFTSPLHSVTITVYAAYRSDSSKKFVVKRVKVGGNMERFRTVQSRLQEAVSRWITKVQPHPHLVHAEELISDPGARCLYLVLDYIDSPLSVGEVLEERGSMCECDARLIFTQVLSAVAHCHDKGYYEIGIDDSCVLWNADTRSVTLTAVEGITLRAAPSLEKVAKQPYYQPKEVLDCVHAKQEEAMFERVASPQRASWALGVLLMRLLIGERPFDSDPLLANDEIRAWDRSKLQKYQLPDQARDLVVQLMDARISPREALQHEWVTGKREERLGDTDEPK